MHIRNKKKSCLFPICENLSDLRIVKAFRELRRGMQCFPLSDDNFWIPSLHQAGHFYVIFYLIDSFTRWSFNGSFLIGALFDSSSTGSSLSQEANNFDIEVASQMFHSSLLFLITLKHVCFFPFCYHY